MNLQNLSSPRLGPMLLPSHASPIPSHRFSVTSHSSPMPSRPADSLASITHPRAIPYLRLLPMTTTQDYYLQNTSRILDQHYRFSWVGPSRILGWKEMTSDDFVRNNPRAGYINTHIHIYISTYLHIQLQRCVPIYIYTYIHIYISTYIHIYINPNIHI